jgi:acyl-coenzyme A synthetase/AMP-(fatty) acid ligase
VTPGPALFNACDYLLDRHIRAGRGDRLALTGAAGDLSYAELAGRVTRAAGALRGLGLQAEQRVVMVMADSPEFVIVYLAAMRIGAVPVPISTMLRADGVAEILADSRARLVAASAPYLNVVTAALDEPGTGEVMAVITDDASQDATVGGLATTRLSELPGGPGDVYPTTADSPAFWLYTSGTTGTPKGAMHRHGSVQVVCETYGAQVLGITPEDRCLSAAKAFFAYGLGNSILFPMSVGAAAVLEPNPSRPEIMAERAGKFAATLFFAGPTFFSNMLRAGLPADALAGVRLAASAGEALPAALYQRWTSHFGIDILDGIGMTEMLHIFLSNRPGQVRAGTTGVAVPGYDLRVLVSRS